MIISEQWLREMVKTSLNAQQIADALTLAGLEVDAVETIGEGLDDVVIGEILTIEKHPDADRLNLTEVYIGGETLNIVCGASNVKVGMRVPVALLGARLPNGLKIKKAKVRGVESFGMLCSASELSLEDESDGLLELPKAAPVGAKVAEYLKLHDTLIDIDLTPNRGDCLSLQGIARELRVLVDADYTAVKIVQKAVNSKSTLKLQVDEPELCPAYYGRVINEVNARAVTPLWMQQRLLRCGIRPISALVDITNYVMLELGQPMHAFDMDKINKGIIVRKASENEKITLLDESTVELTPETLVIADHAEPIAIAGVMGGLDSAIGDDTSNVVLEAAHFTRQCAAGKARSYGLHTESSHRFERGVDPLLPSQAMERATELIISICGGKIGAVNQNVSKRLLGKKKSVTVRFDRLVRVLGMVLKRQDVDKILKRISADVKPIESGWEVTPPSYRFDIELECDLVEEVARVMGYDELEDKMPRLVPSGRLPDEAIVDLRRVKQTLVARGYSEAINYSFVEPELLSELSESENFLKLANPLAENMSAMRTSLLPGLVSSCQFNLNRQQERVRLFELGAVFHKQSDGRIVETNFIGGIVSGATLPSQWSVNSDQVADFYDVKSDLSSIFALTGDETRFIFSTLEHKALHPGQSSGVFLGDKYVGCLGKIHPGIAKKFDLPSDTFVFEVQVDDVLRGSVPSFRSVSKFPIVTRDLALITQKHIAVNDMLITIKKMGIEDLNSVDLFDVYSGSGVADDCKSVAIKLTFQHQERTLKDEEIDLHIDNVLMVLKEKFNTELRN